MASARPPSVVLICHSGARFDAEGLGAWLATEFELRGIVELREPPSALWRRLRRELARVGWLRLLDVLAFRLYRRLALARADAAWEAQEVARLRARYRVDPARLPRLVASDPNDPAVRRFLRRLAPDLVLARCKVLLGAAVRAIPRHGAYVLHPGICPEYRNAHGCFWALAQRDLARVGMTLLRAEAGVDDGPVLLQASYPFDERRESPHVIQLRVVSENLPSIGRALVAVCGGRASGMAQRARSARNWGQPWLSAYLGWRRAAGQAVA